MRAVCVSVLLGVVLTALPSASRAWTPWNEISETDKSLTEVSFAPGAGAVILEEEIQIALNETLEKSTVDVYRRIKILNESGMKEGTVSLHSSKHLRIKDLQARTILPDGLELALPKDAVLPAAASSSADQELVSFAMPGVTPGAIVEYRYREYIDGLPARRHRLQGSLPILTSRFSYELPRGQPLNYRYLGPPQFLADRRTRVGATTNTLIHEFKSLPPVPDEEYSAPLIDRSASLIFDPSGMSGTARKKPEWEQIVLWAQSEGLKNYADVRRHDRDASRLALDLAAGAKSAADKARVIYQFVRDRIGVSGSSGIWAGRNTADAILKSELGTAIERALLLQAMLRAAGIEAELGWSAHRTDGEILRQVVYPGVFDVFLVVAQIDGQAVYLAPSEAKLPFGVLPATLEGAACLLVDQKPPVWVDLPERPASFTTRLAELTFAVNPKGGLTGSGVLRITGHHAIAWFLNANAAKEDRFEHWRVWLAGRLAPVVVSIDEVREDSEAPSVEVKWRAEVPDSDGAFSELAIPLAAPFAEQHNPFTLPASQRLSPVVLPFRESSEVTVRVSWPPGWAIRPPLSHTLRTRAGSLSAAIQVDENERVLTSTRRLVFERTHFSVREYDQVKALYAAAVANDNELALVMHD
ncbi:MAG TPA: DUF3857 and transglutaminase domain-containing protein [Gemmatimonadales bacterium]|nr:DUF3857 and transglutaminase domain-containing protein [Gemmatimonadales bacterium]